MDSPVPHIVHRVCLEVNTRSAKYAYYLKDHLDLFLKDEVFPGLESYFNSLSQKFPPQSSIRIERLDLELSFDNRPHPADLKLKIKAAAEQEIQKKLGQNTSLNHPSDTLVIPAGQKFKNSFLHFLETGTKPWWDLAMPSDFLTGNKEAFKTFTREKSNVAALKRVLQKSHARTRLIKQLNDRQITDLLEQGLLALPDTPPGKLPDLHDFRGLINSHAAKPGFPFLAFRQLAWDILIGKTLNFPDAKASTKIAGFMMKTMNIDIPAEPETAETSISDTIGTLPPISVLMQFESIVRKIQKKIHERQKTEKFPETGKNVIYPLEKNITGNEKVNTKKDVTVQDKIPDTPYQKEPRADYYYVENSGLVLLHPFLKELFGNCRLLCPDHSIKNPEKAAHLLHYIATGREQQYEHAMVFEKFLCNIPATWPINRDIHLSGKIKQQAGDMLNAVLQHWPAMKNASNDLLRNEYLKRPGKIILTGNNPRIVMERKTQDILLDKIAWNISVVKLPWKNKIIFVEW